MKKLGFYAFALMLALPAFGAPETSLRPEPRAPFETIVVTRAALMAALPEMVSLRPSPRPKAIERHGARVQKAMSRRNGRGDKRGSVCGVPEIKGERISRIPGRIKGCGVAEPVRVTSVAGVALTQHPTVDCGTAKAFHKWVKNGVLPAVGKTGGGVHSVKVIAHFACRTRNNRPGAKISEHGKGRAIDVAGVNLRDGSTLSVLNDWRHPKRGKILRKIHKAACGPFGTVLGPEADRYHRDHFHFDTARYRSGSYCR
jgi:hypothetical protein